MKNIIAILLCGLFAVAWFGCEKDFLEKKPATNIDRKSVV